MAERKAVRRPRPEAIPARDALSPGDTVEFSTTVEVRPKKGGSIWIKGGATSSVRPGESALDARDRIEEFVLEGVGRRALEALED